MRGRCYASRMADDDEVCELFPEVDAARIASITISRVVLDEKGAEVLLTLPFRWPSSVQREQVGECAGGGVFRAQPRGKNGAYLKGVAPVTFALDGAPRDFQAPGAMPPVAGAPEAPSVPLDGAATVGASPSGVGPTSAIAVPTAHPLAGMPSATLDLHALPPETRALFHVVHQLNAYTWAGIERRSDGEKDASERVTGIALKSMEELGKLTGTVTKTTVDALLKELDQERARSAELREDVRTLRADREADRVELATLRTRLGLNLPAPVAPQRNLLDVLQAVMVEAVHSLGVPVVAGALGITPERLEAITTSPRPS